MKIEKLTELCSNCTIEVDIAGTKIQQICPNCKENIMPCNLCDPDTDMNNPCTVRLKTSVNMTNLLDMLTDIEKSGPIDSDSIHEFTEFLYLMMDHLAGNRTLEELESIVLTKPLLKRFIEIIK